MDFNPILTEIQSHMAAMSPAAQAAVKMANPSLPSPDATVNSPSVLPPGTLLPHPTDEPPPGNIAMPNSAPPLMPSAQPGVTAPRGTVAGETNEMGRLLHTGSGISQIGSKIENSRLGEAHPFLGKLLGGLAQGAATVGDIGLSAVAPEIAINTPGTAYHHQALVNQEGRQVNAATENAQKQAQAASENATAAKTNADIPLEEAQAANLQQKPQNDREKMEAGLNEHGFTMGDDGKIVPLPYERMSDSQQAVHDLKASQEELADASAALKKAQTSGIPAQVQMAQQRIATAQQNALTAAGRLGLGRESLNFRQQEEQDKQDQPSTYAHGRADQGRAVVESANNLKKFIDDHPAVFGNIGSYWKQYTNETPIADKDASKAMAEIASFAALQPALHGMRGGQVMKEFEKMTGGIPKNADALKAAIDGIVESAANPMIHAGTKPSHSANQQPEAGAAENWVRDPKTGKLVKQ